MGTKLVRLDIRNIIFLCIIMFSNFYSKPPTNNRPVNLFTRNQYVAKPFAEIRPISKKIDIPVTEQTPVQHSDNYKIVIILDESGSMQPIQKDIVQSINDLIKEQKSVKDRKCNFTLVKFSDDVKRTISNVDLNYVSELTTKDYQPNNGTALFDAIGDTIDWFRYESNVLMIIVTDGQENASKKYTSEMVTHLLSEKQKYRDWSYIYLSNNEKTYEQGNNIGLRKTAYTSNCVIDQNKYGSYISKDINTAIKNYREKNISVQAQLNR